MNIAATVHIFCALIHLSIPQSSSLLCKGRSSSLYSLNDRRNGLFFVNYSNQVSHIDGTDARPRASGGGGFNPGGRTLRLVSDDAVALDQDVERILYGIENPEQIRGPYIAQDGRIVNKKKKLYSTGELCHVDDFFEGKFRVEWTVRGVREKLQYRYRETHTLPLSTSRFSLMGIKGFILRLWLDGHRGSKKGHIAMSLVQQEHWAALESPICLFAGNIVRGPFFYRSPEYFLSAKSLCRLEDVLENNTIKLGVMIAKRNDRPSGTDPLI